MKYSKLLLFLSLWLCVSILTSQIALSIAISPAKVEIDFRPNLKTSINFQVTSDGTKDIELYVNGYLAKYAKLSKTEIKRARSGVPIPVVVILEFPEDVDVYGRQRILVGAREALPKIGGGIGARAAIQVPIYINIPYPGKYIDVSYNVPDVEVGQTVEFSLAVNSKGREFIHKAKAEIEVYGDENNTLAKVYTNELSIAPGETKQLTAEWMPAAPIPGEYRAIARVNYDGIDKEFTRNFHIGDLIVEIVDTSHTFYKDIINEFNIYIISKWNNVMSNVHGEVNIYFNDKRIDKILTPTIELPGWSGQVLTAYWNTKNLTIGTYKVEVIVPYASKVAKKEFNIELIEGQPPKKEKPVIIVEEEKPEKKYVFSWTTILIIIIALLIIINIVWLFHSSKR